MILYKLYCMAKCSTGINEMCTMLCVAQSNTKLPDVNTINIDHYDKTKYYKSFTLSVKIHVKLFSSFSTLHLNKNTACQSPKMARWIAWESTLTSQLLPQQQKLHVITLTQWDTLSQCTIISLWRWSTTKRYSSIYIKTLSLEKCPGSMNSGH